jgi:hypothetical protein
VTSLQLAPLLPIQPLFAEGRILAGFLNEQSASRLAEFLRAPAADQKCMREKFEAITRVTSRNPLPPARFREIDEQEAIQALGRVAGRCGGPFALTNLAGFQWIEVAGIIAGRYVSAPMPTPGRFPSSTASVEEIANFCLLGDRIVIEEDLSMVVMPPNIVVVSPDKLRLLPQLHPNLGPQKGLLIEYVIDREPSPISVFCVDDRVVAVTHQERLVALLEAGIKEALCLVYYGYGTEALTFLQQIEQLSLTGDNPPYITDFMDDELMVRVPVSKPRTLITLSQGTIDLALID